MLQEGSSLADELEHLTKEEVILIKRNRLTVNRSRFMWGVLEGKLRDNNSI